MATLGSIGAPTSASTSASDSASASASASSAPVFAEALSLRGEGSSRAWSDEGEENDREEGEEEEGEEEEGEEEGKTRKRGSGAVKGESEGRRAMEAM